MRWGGRSIGNIVRLYLLIERDPDLNCTDPRDPLINRSSSNVGFRGSESPDLLLICRFANKSMFAKISLHPTKRLCLVGGVEAAIGD